MSFRLLLRIIQARIPIVLTVMLFFSAATVLASLAISKKYETTTRLLVEAKSSALGRPLVAEPPLLQVMTTQADLLMSDRVLLTAAAQIKLTPEELVQLGVTIKEATHSDYALLAWLNKKLVVTFNKGSNVLTLSIKTAHPDTANRLLNEVSLAYLEISQALKSEQAQRYAQQLSAQIERQRDQIEDAQSKLSTFESENRLITSQSQLDQENLRLQNLLAQLNNLQGVTINNRAQAVVSQANAANSQPVQNNVVIQTLRRDLIREEASLKQLENQWGLNHPQYQAAQARVNTLQAKLQTEMNRLAAAIETGVEAGQYSQTSIEKAITEQKARILELNQLKDVQRLLKQDLQQKQQSYSQLILELEQARVQAASAQPDASVLSMSQTGHDPISPKPLLGFILSLPVGLLLGITTALFNEKIERKVRLEDDVTQTMQVALLGHIDSAKPQILAHYQQNNPYKRSQPVSSEMAQLFDHHQLDIDDPTLSAFVPAAFYPHSTFAEQLRQIRSQLMLSWLNRQPLSKTLTVISPQNNDGRSFVSANLAVVFSQMGMRTLLIDVDMRQPSQHIFFKLDNRRGLSDILLGKAGSEVAHEIKGLPYLRVLSSGPRSAHPDHLLTTPVLGRLIGEANKAFDIILLDTPAHDLYTDGYEIAKLSGFSLLVTRQDQSMLQRQQQLLGELQSANITVLGTVLNHVGYA